jgi:hypothetical protein
MSELVLLDLTTRRELSSTRPFFARGAVAESGLLALSDVNPHCGGCGVRLFDAPGWRDRLRLRGEREIVTSLAFDPGGRRLASGGLAGTVRLWRVADGRPLWLAPLLTARPAALVGHLGVVHLGSGRAGPLRRWQRAAQDRGRLGRTLSDRWLCLSTREAVELWDMAADRRLARIPSSAAVFELEALPGGCVVLEALARRPRNLTTPMTTRVWLFRRGQDRRELTTSDEAAALGLWGDRIVRAEGRRLVLHDLQGRSLGRHRLPFMPHALAGQGRRLLAGTGDGRVYATDAPPAGRWRELDRLEVRAPVARVAPGPGGMVAAGLVDGTFAAWDARSGKLLVRERLQGPALHLVWSGARLHAASDLGDHLAVDLSALTRDRCALLREVWRLAPYAWRGDELVPAPPRRHRCR